MHPLADIICAAASGHFPDPDGAVEILPAWRPGLEAAVALTGHGYLCLEPGRGVPEAVVGLASNGFGGVSDPRVVAALAGAEATADDIDSLDVLMVAPHLHGDPPIRLIVSETEDHPRVTFARRLRDDLQVLSPADCAGDVVLVGTGVAGLPEMSIELSSTHRGHGRGADLLRSALLGSALADRPVGQPVLAMVAPGNSRSLRCFLAAGFTPLGSAQLWHRQSVR